MIDSETRMCRNKESGELFLLLAVATDTAVSHQDRQVVQVYCPDDRWNTIYVCEMDEFEQKFEPAPSPYVRDSK